MADTVGGEFAGNDSVPLRMEIKCFWRGKRFDQCPFLVEMVDIR